MNSILYVMRMGSLKSKNTKDFSRGSPGLEFPCWPGWLMGSMYSLMDDLLVVEIVFPKNYFTPLLFLSFQTAQHLTLRPQGFNKNPELPWVKQGRNNSITALKTAREHLCTCVRKKMCISMY